jgi:cytochrome P450
MQSNWLYDVRRKSLTSLMVGSLGVYSKLAPFIPARPQAIPVLTLGDFRPLENNCFQNPYAFYKLLRDQYPVYQLPNGVFCVSRYWDIVHASRDVGTFSSTHQGVVANLRPGQNLNRQIRRFEALTNLGVIPADVLATSDQPDHTAERKIGHTSLNARFVKSLEPEVEALCQRMMADVVVRGKLEFMRAFGWRLPMILIIRLLGLPEQDFEQIKHWCVAILDSQNGIQTKAELAQSYVAALSFLRYCWQQFRMAQQNPQDNLMGLLARSVANSDSGFSDAKAASAIFQLLIAGSDSSATTMGNALKMLIENPGLQQQMREDETLIPAFIEEVFRLESAFQGHFRWLKKPTQLHGVTLPKGSRVFLMWASGNRDERFWQQPDDVVLNRKNAKKHLTFGHGIHACLGRELARMEIRIVLKAFLSSTKNLRIDGATPYIASMFARTLVQLPIAFEVSANYHE